MVTAFLPKRKKRNESGPRHRRKLITVIKVNADNYVNRKSALVRYAFNGAKKASDFLPGARCRCRIAHVLDKVVQGIA
jgi:hypothetical protein